MWRRARAIARLKRQPLRRAEDDKPNAKITNSWNENTRIKKRSILKVEKKLQEKHYLPQNREKEHYVDKDIPPNQNLKKPSICLDLKKKVSKQNSDIMDLQLTGLQTIQEYPDNWIHIYTDGSAMKGTVNAGFGAKIEYPDKSIDEISSPCGAFCSNFEAEALAMKTAISKIPNNPNKLQNIVLFTDSKSVLEALKHETYNLPVIRDLAFTINHFIKTFDKNITLQWIPSHCNINGNERADKLAKKGAMEEQPQKPVSQLTCKQIIKSNSKIEWLNNWAMCNKGRQMFPYMTTPNIADPINNLGRRDQTIIFRLRSQHVQLNMHLNRINPMHEPNCILCPHPYETVQHLLFECPKLSNLRKLYLPTSPNIGNTLYGQADQLKNTAVFFIMATRQRTEVQVQAGSRK